MSNWQMGNGQWAMSNWQMGNRQLAMPALMNAVWTGAMGNWENGNKKTMVICLR